MSKFRNGNPEADLRGQEELRALLAKVRRIELRSRRKAENILSGEYKTVFKGTGIEFEEVREYQRGDDIRSIDWNVTARMGHLFIKKYREERELTVYLLVDVSGSQFVGSTARTRKDLAEELTAVLGFSATRNKDKLGLILFSDRIERLIPAGKGTFHFMRILREVLATNPVDRPTSLRTALEYCNKLLKRKAIIFLISDFFDSGYLRTLRMTAGRHDLVPVVLRDSMERALPAGGVLAVEDPESGETAWLDTGARSFRDNWEEQCRQRDSALEKEFRKYNLDSLFVGTGEDYIPPLMSFFRRRAARY